MMAMVNVMQARRHSSPNGRFVLTRLCGLAEAIDVVILPAKASLAAHIPVLK
jgi:hypothetical protein